MTALALNSTSTPQQARRLIREGRWQQHTSGLAAGYAQTNLVILPSAQADDFLRFCQSNPKPCPVLDVTEPGDPHPRQLGKDIDLRSDLPTYRIYLNGQLDEERHDIIELWRDDLVAFSIGCSFSFEEALIAEGLDVRHISEQRNVPMYRTNIPLVSSRLFGGSMVVSMRPFTAAQAIRAIQITSDMPRVHGAPIHLGDPAQIGITNLQRPDFGDPPVIDQGETPVFWACGVTPQLALEKANLPLVITHSPGHMLITDVPNHRLKFG